MSKTEKLLNELIQGAQIMNDKYLKEVLENVVKVYKEEQNEKRS